MVLSAPRQTRSQVTQEWTTKESLILVNEITAVETDCLKTLSMYQKWKIVVENCTALDLTRTLNQCRRKWDSLLSECNLIKSWESKFGSTDSYWLLETEKRKENGLPEEMDYEVFKAVDDYVRAFIDDSGSDADDDPEADPDLLEVISKLDTRRQRRRSMHSKTADEEESEHFYDAEENLHEVPIVDETMNAFAGEEPQTYEVKVSSDVLDPLEEGIQETVAASASDVAELLTVEVIGEETPQIFCREETPHQTLVENEVPKCCNEGYSVTFSVKENMPMIDAEDEPRKSKADENNQNSATESLENPPILIQEEPEKNCMGQKPKRKCTQGPKRVSKAEKEKTIVEKLCKDVEMIHAIVNGNTRELAEFKSVFCSMNSGDFQCEFARKQGDMLIGCLSDIVNIVKQFPHLFQASNV